MQIKIHVIERGILIDRKCLTISSDLHFKSKSYHIQPSQVRDYLQKNFHFYAYIHGRRENSGLKMIVS